MSIRGKGQRAYLNRRVESAFSLVEGKAEAVIFPRNVASSTRNFSLKMMASISAVGSLPKHFPANPSALNPLPPPVSSRHMDCRSRSDSSTSSDGSLEHTQRHLIDRRQMVISSLGLLAATVFNSQTAESSIASEFADMPALRGKDYGKTKMRYPDYTETNSGLQYKDLRVGAGPIPKIGETVEVDWDGFTIGYYGRIFEARNKTKGGSFVGDDKDFFKFRLGSREVIPAFEEAVSGMALGGIRRIVVPPELGYPENDFNKKGPRPTTFSGQRALDFVLRNQGLIDKTLLFDIELIKIIPNGNS